MYMLRALWLLSYFSALFCGQLYGQDSIAFKVDIGRDGDSSTSFNGTVVVCKVENGIQKTIRIPGSDRKLQDSVHINKSMLEFSLDRGVIFAKGQEIAKFRFIVFSSRYMPMESWTWMKLNEDNLVLRVLIESRENYRARADGIRVPFASSEIRRLANSLDLRIHKDLVEELEKQAKEEERLQVQLPLKKAVSLTNKEKSVVANCLQIIRGCQLADGAFVMKKNGNNAESPIWIQPYFGNHAALALLAANEKAKNAEDVRRVANWLNWSVKNQSNEGFWYEFEGNVMQYRSNSKIDAWDSSAALFLMVAERYERAGQKLNPNILTAARKAFHCIQVVEDPSDGLTWAKPDYKVKFLLDNIETYGGLVAAETIFKNAQLQREALHAREMSDRIGAALEKYWVEKEQLYSYALHENGRYDTNLNELYPQGLAQLFGISFIRPEGAAWEKVIRQFRPENDEKAAAGIERWLSAATNLEKSVSDTWRKEAFDSASRFTSQTVYIHRPSLMVLAGLEGADWMPRISQRVSE